MHPLFNEMQQWLNNEDDTQLKDAYETVTQEDVKADQDAVTEAEKEEKLEEEEQKNAGLKKAPHVRPHRFRPGTVALREIRRYQRSHKLLIAKAEFESVVSAMVYSFYPRNITFQQTAMHALQEAAESYLVSFFENANLFALHAHRVNVCPEDIQTAITMLRKHS
uniref:Core Histone H2A/H2B/H3 domain-containing protein n=1 Tax=Elphidium margaritaceum TaxID=933848 RepID=A0A7S0TE83_9EUKA